MICSVLDYLERAAEKYPEKTVFSDIYKGICYREFEQRAFDIGTCIVSHGLELKSPVVVFLDKNIEALLACFGVLFAGGVYVPFDTDAPIGRLNLMLEVLQPSYIITDQKNYEKACSLAFPKGKALLIHELYQGCKGFEQEVIKRKEGIVDTDPVYIICTSGSTGPPKGVVLPHRAVIDFTEEASEAMQFSEQEVFANEAPFYFDASVPDIYCTIRNCATMHIIPGEWFLFPIKVLRYLQKNRVNAVFWVPSALIAVANLRALGEVDISGLKKVMFCGEVMPVKQLNMWKKYLPDTMYVNYYGPTETAYASTYYVIDREFQNDEVLPIGKPAKNTRVYILDDNGDHVAEGETGELCIGGSGLALGYYNDLEKTNESFCFYSGNKGYPERIYKTGDLVKENTRGEIEYVGRKDLQIKRKGYRIELGEIEAAAMAIEGVDRVCCVYNSRRDTIFLIYEGQKGEDMLEKELRTKLPGYMMPKVIREPGGLPVNANRKVDRVRMKERYGRS